MCVCTVYIHTVFTGLCTWGQRSRWNGLKNSYGAVWHWRVSYRRHQGPDVRGGYESTEACGYVDQRGESCHGWESWGCYRDRRQHGEVRPRNHRHVERRWTHTWNRKIPDWSRETQQRLRGLSGSTMDNSTTITFIWLMRGFVINSSQLILFKSHISIWHNRMFVTWLTTYKHM